MVEYLYTENEVKEMWKRDYSTQIGVIQAKCIEAITHTHTHTRGTCGFLQRWRDEGKITFSASEPCTATKAFWDWMNEILWDSYVPHCEVEQV